MSVTTVWNARCLISTTLTDLLPVIFGSCLSVRPAVALNGARPLDVIVGGWELGGIVELRSGDPFTVGMSGDVANVGNGLSGPNRIASGKASNPSVDSWFDPSAFATPAPYTFGNSGRNILRTDALENWICLC